MPVPKAASPKYELRDALTERIERGYGFYADWEQRSALGCKTERKKPLDAVPVEGFPFWR